MRRVWLTALLLIAPLRASAGQPEIQYGPAAEWVEDVPVSLDDPVSEADVRDGVYVLLFDRQTRVGSSTVESFEHMVQRVVSQPGVDASSQITIDFDPTYQDLWIHSVRIRRGTEHLEGLDPANVRVLQRETELEQKVFDGTHTATLILEDVRIGDVIEYSFTRRGQNPVFGGRYLDFFWTAGRHAYQRLRFRLLWPSQRALHVTPHGSTVEPRLRQVDDLTEYVWTLEDTDPILPDSDLPVWFFWYPWVELSEFRSWEEVASWGAALFATPVQLAPSIQAVVDDIASRHERNDERLLAALRFVQDEVRYLAIEIGPHSHRPHDPELVLKRRFGDCKDKTILLLSMLRVLGIEARAALLNTDLSTRVEQWHPNPYAFNHAIVRARLGGKVLWLDPSVGYQRGGLDQVGWESETTALALDAGVTELERVRPERSRLPAIRIEYALDATDFDAAASLAITTEYSGHRANELRGFLAGRSREEVRSAYLEFYAAQYPKIEQVKDIEIEDEQTTNLIRVTESYSIPDFWEVSEDGKRTAEYYPMEIRSRIVLPDTRSRKMPIAHRHPDHVSLRIKARHPAPLELTSREQLVEDPAFRLAYRRKSEGRDLELFYEYESLADHVSPEAASAHYDRIDEAWELLSYSVWMYPSVGSGAARWLVRTAPPVLFLVFLLPWLASRAAQRMYVRGRPRAAARWAQLAHALGFLHVRPGLARASHAVQLGMYRSALGQLSAGEDLLTSALRRSMGGGRMGARVHASALVALAQLRDRQRRFEDARDCLRRAEDVSVGLTIPSPQQAVRRLLDASLSAKLGDATRAVGALAAAETLGRGDRWIAYIAAEVRADVLEAEGDIAGARDRYTHNLRYAEETFGPDHFLAGHAAKEFAEFESRQGDAIASARLRERALRSLGRLLPKDSIDLAWLGSAAPEGPALRVSAAPDAPTARVSRPRRWLAVVLSIVWPGLGHAYSGEMLRALGAVVLLAVGMQTIIARAGHSAPPMVWAGLQLTGFAVLIAIAVDAARCASRPRRRFHTRGGVALACLVFAVVSGAILEASNLARDAWVARPLRTPSDAMLPTLLVGDHFYIDPRAYADADPVRGDIVAFHAARDGQRTVPYDRNRELPAEVYVKRIVGIPGDSIRFEGASLYVNGSLRTEPNGSSFPARDGWVVQVKREDPGGRVYRVADDPSKQGWSSATFQVEADRYFVAGDNRDHSDDSRFWGTVHEGDILGRVTRVYWSADFSGAWEELGRTWSVSALLRDRIRWGRIASPVDQAP